MRSLIVGFDFECPGGVISDNGFTQLGATIHDVDTGDVLARFNMYANLDGFSWEKRCVREFWSQFPARYKETREKCASSTFSCAQVIKFFMGWVREHTAGTNAFLATDNSAYDGALLRSFAKDDVFYLFTDAKGKPVYKCVQDINCFYRGIAAHGQGVFLLDSTSDKGSKDTALKALGLSELPDWGVSHDHDAVNDSEKMIKDLCFILRHMRTTPR